ncbi:rhodanese-like domain-containing protein [Marinobacter salexigens]|uniref:rhodanese-like domain-containing protein n=1 Tax=Marinobacter salexigens TaxID=1925763 RepID=UPI00195FCF55|nr:rhodanese-like domain-containing protein [Marinobacter salexigens]
MNKLCMLMLMFALPVLASTAHFSSDGYRTDRYRSPTPATVAGVQTVDTQKLQTLLDTAQPPIVIDVINSEYRASLFIETEPHVSVPGAYWLPNTGRGELDQQWHNYLVENALRLTENNKSYPIVVMCKSDCWLSWNAARRLHKAGFTQLYWYKDGIDSWQDSNLPVETITPVPPEF